MDDVVLVGPCAAGKTTLARGLRAHGFRVHPIAQEHSGIRDLWRKHAAQSLVYLDVDLINVHRRGRASFPGWLHQEQRQRLAEARAGADYYLDTSGLSIAEVLQHVLEFLSSHQIVPSAAEAIHQLPLNQ